MSKETEYEVTTSMVVTAGTVREAIEDVLTSITYDPDTVTFKVKDVANDEVVHTSLSELNY